MNILTPASGPIGSITSGTTLTAQPPGAFDGGELRGGPFLEPTTGRLVILTSDLLSNDGSGEKVFPTVTDTNGETYVRQGRAEIGPDPPVAGKSFLIEVWWLLPALGTISTGFGVIYAPATLTATWDRSVVHRGMLPLTVQQPDMEHPDFVSVRTYGDDDTAMRDATYVRAPGPPYPDWSMRHDGGLLCCVSLCEGSFPTHAFLWDDETAHYATVANDWVFSQVAYSYELHFKDHRYPGSNLWQPGGDWGNQYPGAPPDPAGKWKGMIAWGIENPAHLRNEHFVYDVRLGPEPQDFSVQLDVRR